MRYLKVITLWSLVLWLLALRDATALTLCFSILALWAMAVGHVRFPARLAMVFGGLALFALGFRFEPPWRGILSVFLGPVLVVAGSVGLVAGLIVRRFRESKASSSRKAFQFGLSTLCMFVVLVSITLAWLAVENDCARRERVAATAIRDSGGTVYYAYPEALEGYTAAAGTQSPWLERLLSHDLFNHVAVASVRDAEQVRHCTAFPRLRLLILRGNGIGDAELRQVASIARLRYLNVESRSVTDAGLEHLSALKELDTLQLSGTAVTPAGTQRIRRALPHVHLFELQGDETTFHGPGN